MFKSIHSLKEEGFTLIELMVVVGIIAILGGIALPIFLNQQAESAKASVRSDVRNSVTSLSTELSANPDATTAELQAVAVISPNNTLTVSGSGRSYTITGSANTVSSWTYTFNSVTGSYSDNSTPAPN